MSRFHDENQMKLDIEIGEEIERQKIARRKKLTKTKFDRNQLSFDDLDKITFEISCKDFEFFYAYILEKEGYIDVTVSQNDKDMVDIRAMKNGKKYLIQCKQWTSKDISVQQVAEMYSKMYHEYFQDRENTVMRIVTTSYFDQYSREFLQGNNIEGINNIELIETCMK
jgi:HJR/Mrr/RecB family endonuclease